MVKVIVGIGSNCGNRKENITKTIDWLRSLLTDFKCSQIYETPAVGKISRPYLNAVAEGIFENEILVLNRLLKEQEKEMGRDEECRKREDVPIDIDIVIADEVVIKPWDYNQRFFRIGFDEIINKK